MRNRSDFSSFNDAGEWINTVIQRASYMGIIKGLPFVYGISVPLKDTFSKIFSTKFLALTDTFRLFSLSPKSVGSLNLYSNSYRLSEFISL